MIARIVLSIALLSLATSVRVRDSSYYALKFHDHAALSQLKRYVYSVIDKGRIQIFELRPEYTFGDLPETLRVQLKQVDPAVLSKTPVDPWKLRLQQAFGYKTSDDDVRALVDLVEQETYTATVEAIVGFGRRTSEASIQWMADELSTMGYEPVLDYNLSALKRGTSRPDELVIIVGHMDTVANTVGADDNASGAAGVLEAARIFANVDTERSILFLITEDEERGLLGAKRYVRSMQDQGRLADIKFAVNMDMIAYNDNGIVDLETTPPFEELADWMA